MKTLTFTATVQFTEVQAESMTDEQWADWFASFVPSAPFPLADDTAEVIVRNWNITDEQITE
jgi:3-phenylpropionate/cinnamic acid dioxygenase small subunit